MSYLFVVDGTDCSGKKTVTEQVVSRLTEEGYDVLHLSFPMYEQPSSSLVQMYLSGELGLSADFIDPKVASSFYSIDRVGSYLNGWKKDYEAKRVIICDRYTSANAIHQAAKFNEEEERVEFLNWLHELEFEVLQIPRPTQTFYLHMPLANIFELNKERLNKINNQAQKDIHENDDEFMKRSYETGLWVADYLRWTVVHNVTADSVPYAIDGNKGILRPIDETVEEVVAAILPQLTHAKKN